MMRSTRPPRFGRTAASIVGAVLLLAAPCVAPLAAQAPPPLPPTSPPPPAPVASPAAPVPTIQRSSPPPAPVARSVDEAPTPAASSATPPAGATMRCKDGLWLSGPPAASRCDRNGGLAVILPVRAAAPPAPQPPRAP